MNQRDNPEPRGGSTGAPPPPEGEFISAGDSQVGVEPTSGFANFRAQTGSVFAAAEARLRAAHTAVATHVDQRISSQFDARLAEARTSDTYVVSDAAAETFIQTLRDDFAARQQRLTERLAESMQGLALQDVGAATALLDKAGQAAADALRPPKVINPQP